MLRVLLDTNILLSGLFFKGNERELLMAVLQGKIKCVIPEDVYEEWERIISHKFRETENLDMTIELAYAIFFKCQIIPREMYVSTIEDAKTIIADVKDVPVLACAIKSVPDYLVTGDEDFHKIQKRVRFKIVRTKQLLIIIEEGKI